MLGCKISTAWDDQIQLDGFPDQRRGVDVYWLGHLNFPLSQVLNQLLDSQLVQGRGQVIEGWILASGLKPIPEGYHHGTVAPFELAFLDQHENEICHGGHLFVDRTWKGENKFVGRGSSLYGPEETSATSEPDVGQNINNGRVPDEAPSSPNQGMPGHETKAASEILTRLRNAISQLQER